MRRAYEAIHPDDPQLRSWYQNYGSSHQKRIAFDLSHLRNECQDNPEASILDIGCTPMIFLAACQHLGLNVQGVDLAPERFATAVQNLKLDVVACDIEQQPLPFPDDWIDVIVFNELFEHLRINPIATLQQVFRILRPGGKLLLSTPNLKSLHGIANFLFRSRAYSCAADPYLEYSKLINLGHMGHVREYTATEVTSFLDDLGFQVQSIIYRGRYRYRSGWEIHLSRLIPSLSPFMTIVASKPE